MNDTLIVTAFVITDDLMSALGHHSHACAHAPDAEVVTVAIAAAACFQNHQERALCVLRGLGYLSGSLSISRFNRRIHALADWLLLLLDTLGALFSHGEAFIIDSMPVPVCRRVRAGRCRKVRGRAYCGWCAAKREKVFGWRLHLVCTPAGVPVAFDLLPAGLHDLTPIHELTVGLPAGASVYGDKAYNSHTDEATILAETGVRLVPIDKANMAPNSWEEVEGLWQYRKGIESVNSQMTAWGIQRLHARTNEGFAIKVHATVLAVALTNAD
jgi:Transposase DDE domain